MMNRLASVVLMRRFKLVILILFVSVYAFGVSAVAQSNTGRLVGTVFAPDGGVIPMKFTRTAQDPVSPKLEWKNILPNAVSFTVIVHDPDTSRNKTTEDVLHWMIVNHHSSRFASTP